MVNNMSPQEAKRVIESIKKYLIKHESPLAARDLDLAVEKLRAISYRIGMQA